MLLKFSHAIDDFQTLAGHDIFSGTASLQCYYKLSGRMTEEHTKISDGVKLRGAVDYLKAREDLQRDLDKMEGNHQLHDV